MSAGTRSDFRGTDRFEIVRRIGAGGMGVVYEALDRERGMPVAVKTLPGIDPSALLRFKNEFRALADVVHPNLVTLYELFAEGEQWYFTMELVNGVSFLEYARALDAGAGQSDSEAETVLPTITGPVSGTRSGSVNAVSFDRSAPGRCDEARLGRTLPQLGAALAALHSAGKLHCDIKPANVLVTPEGRVVVLDFGVALSLHGEARMARHATGGTIAYMAPEQAAGEPLSPAADVYAVGVMLFEAAAGRRPFSGEAFEIMRDKQTVTPPPLTSIVPSVSAQLSGLCERLLDRRADQRPSARELAKTGMAGGATPAMRVPESTGEFLVGRERHLALLQEAYDQVEDGRAAVVVVRAPSGMGKSVLVAHFLKGIAARPEAVVIAGRCYENEFVPYKAVDSLMDDLARLLDADRQLIADASLPADAGLLAQMFPVLRPVVGSSPAAMTVTGSVHEIRRRAFSVLRGLLSHIGKSRVLVLHVDDLHWGDVDSAALLAHVLREPEPPRLLFLTSYRSDDAVNNRCVQALLQEPAFDRATVLEVSPLGHDDSRTLAAELLAHGGQPDATAADAIATESRGNPYFIRELVQRHVRQGAEAGPRDATTLDAVLRGRIEALAADSRRLLEVVAVSGQPLRENDAFAAAGLAARDPAVLGTLRKSHLVRTATRGDAVILDTYHDRIRETLLSSLNPAALADRHRVLAETLEQGQADAETLARHWDGAGNHEQACRHYITAAGAAAASLTFDLAARLYRRALDLGIAGPAEQRAVQVKLAESLANAGRAHDAAVVYRAAADGAGDSEARQLWRQAAHLYCLCGYADEGRALFDDLFRAAQLTLPATPGAALRMLIWDRLWLKAFGTQPASRTPGAISKAEQNRIDLIWAAATGLMNLDPITGAALQGRGLRLALKCGDPTRIARALTFAAMSTVFTGGASAKRDAMALLQQARELSTGADVHSRALIALIEAQVHWLLDRRWEAADRAHDEAEALLRNVTASKTWELSILHSQRVWSMFFRGRMQAGLSYSAEVTREARERGDVYLPVNLDIICGVNRRLLADDPAGASAFLETIGESLPQITSILRVMQIFMRYHIELYDQRPSAWQVVIETWPYLKATHQLRIEQMRIQMYHLRANCALTTLQTATQPAFYVKEAERMAALLAREQAPWAVAESQLIRAGLAAWHGDRLKAIELLDVAARTCESLELGQIAPAARRQQGILMGGERGRAQVEAADAFLASQGCRAPEKMMRMWATIPVRPS